MELPACPGPLSSGMPAFSSGMDRQTVERPSQLFSLPLLVACKITDLFVPLPLSFSPVLTKRSLCCLPNF